MREKTSSLTTDNAFDIERFCHYFSERSPQPVIVVEGATHIVRYANDAFARLVGTERSQLVGQPFAEAVPEGGENGCIPLLDRVYQTGTPETLAEQEHDHGKVPSVYWSYSVWPVMGPDARPLGVAVQVTDASEIALFRKQATAMNGQLMFAAAHQHELTETAQDANRLKDEFLATLSHELRTPLTVIIGWADMLLNPKIDASRSRQAIEVIRRNARVQSQLIDDLLDVSRIMSGKLRLTMKSVDLGAIARATVDGLRPVAEEKEIQMQLQLSPPTGQSFGDPDRLQQVVWNLVSNAIKFTPAGGTVTVSVDILETSAELCVSDTGEGIPAEFLPHVFDRFRQADSSSTRQFGGLGLGLSIVRQLVELHGGTVRVQSEGENRGSTFTMCLPLVLRSEAQNDTDTVQALPLPLPHFECPPELHNLRILVVDDEADTRDMLKFVLESCGSQVKTAISAAAAVEAVREEVFDVLISDIGLPNEDGFLSHHKVRALGQERGGKIPAAAALTAYAGEEDRIRVLRAGFQMHVPKPISPSEWSPLSPRSPARRDGIRHHPSSCGNHQANACIGSHALAPIQLHGRPEYLRLRPHASRAQRKPQWALALSGVLAVRAATR
jgi:PAS domain S-box-containing protein